MPRYLAIIFFVTVFPTVVLVGTAIYVGQNLYAVAEETQPVGNWGDGQDGAGLERHSDDRDEKGFRSLFDGKSLKGWEGKQGVFRTEKGAIVAGNLKEPIPNNEFLCTKTKYGDFELRLKAKLVGDGRNAGIQFRSKRIPDHHEVIGYQCDMGKMGDRSIWGALYDESRRRKFLAEGDHEKTNAVTKLNEWNDLVIRCKGSRIQIWLNGYQTVDYTEQDKTIDRSGIIGLQIHGGKPAEAWYKDLRIKVLK